MYHAFFASDHDSVGFDRRGQPAVVHGSRSISLAPGSYAFSKILLQPTFEIIPPGMDKLAILVNPRIAVRSDMTAISCWFRLCGVGSPDKENLRTGFRRGMNSRYRPRGRAPVAGESRRFRPPPALKTRHRSWGRRPAAGESRRFRLLPIYKTRYQPRWGGRQRVEQLFPAAHYTLNGMVPS